MTLQALTSVLWRERQLLELLVFKLEQERLLLTSGKTRWLGHATREVEHVLEQIRETELGRAVESDAVSRTLGLPPGRTLHELADAAPSPWNDLLQAHREAFLELTTQIETLTVSNRELMTTSHRATQQALANLLLDSRTRTASDSAAQFEVAACLPDRRF